MIIYIVLLAAVGVLGDYFIKRASQLAHFYSNIWFILGALTYALTAFGWVYVMRTSKLSTIGIVYSLAITLLLIAVGTTIFKESLSLREVIGIILSIVSLILLARFA